MTSQACAIVEIHLGLLTILTMTRQLGIDRRETYHQRVSLLDMTSALQLDNKSYKLIRVLVYLPLTPRLIQSGHGSRKS